MTRPVMSILTCLASLFIGLLCWAAPTQVFVNAAYTPENSRNHAFGVNSFATIQAGIDAVEPGGTVTVAAGVYTERLTIAKPLSLLGPQYGVDPNDLDTRLNPIAEAQILPPTHDTSVPGGIMITIDADNVVVSGFTIDGDNPMFSGTGENAAGIDINAAVGIGNPTKVHQGIIIAHNIIKDLFYSGVYFDNPELPIQLEGMNSICYNRIENLPDAGMGVLIRRQYFSIENNTLLNLGKGIHIGFLSSADGTAVPVIAGNTIDATKAGIKLFLFNDLTRKAGPCALIEKNTIRVTTTREDDSTYPTAGIMIIYIEHQSKIFITNNTLTGGDAGIFCWELPTYNPTNVTITDTTINNARYGLWFINYLDMPQSGPARPSGVLFSNVTINNPEVAGIFLDDDNRGDGPVTLTSLGVTVQGGPIGLRLHGPRTAINGGVNLVGQTVQSIVTEAGAQQLN